MTALIIISFIFGSLAGIGSVCFIMGKMLEKRNNFGDCHAEAYFYSNGISISDRADKIGMDDQNHLAYLESHAPSKALYPTAPTGNDQVGRTETLK